MLERHVLRTEGRNELFQVADPADVGKHLPETACSLPQLWQRGIADDGLFPRRHMRITQRVAQTPIALGTPPQHREGPLRKPQLRADDCGNTSLRCSLGKTSDSIETIAICQPQHV